MKPSVSLVLLWSSILVLVAGFSSQDHEIFRLKDEISANEGPEVSFYDFLGVSATASQEEIAKAYRKTSRKLHPDKVKQSFIAARATATRKPKLGKALNSKGKKKPGVNVNKPPSQSEIQREVDVARKRYERLSVVVEILKGSGRERYDYFLSHGFPKWRGTGYYYARFRPGLGTVLVGLFVGMGGAAHYGAMYLGWKRQRDFVERYIKHARRSAWGDDTGIRGIPGLDGGTNTLAAAGAGAAQQQSSLAQENGAAVLNRRQKRQQDKDAKKENKKGKKGGNDSGTSTPLETEVATPAASAGPQGARKKVTAENGKVLIVDSLGNVYLEEEDEDGHKAEFLLDPNEIPEPTIKDTVLYRLPIWAYQKIRTRVFGKELTGRRLGDATEGEESEDTDSADEKKPMNGSLKKRGKRKTTA